MDELRTLPKQFAEVIFLKILLAIVLIISVALMAVGGLAIFLYTEQYPLHTIVIFVLMLWTVFLLILVAGLYFKSKSFNQQKSELMAYANKEALILALHGANTLLRKWRQSE